MAKKLAAPFKGGRVGKKEQLEVESDKISTRSEVGEAVGKAALDLEKSLFV